MAVLIEAISVVIQIETIAEKYPGGIERYIDDCPNRTLCMDETIVRVGFMTGVDAQDYIESLECLGFSCAVGDEFDEIAVVDQFDGLFLPCDWLEHLKLVIFEGDMRLSICKSKGKSIGDIAFPLGWRYETSLSKRTLSVDSKHLEERMVFLRSEGEVDYYLDTLSGEEMFVHHPVRKNGNAEEDEREETVLKIVCPYCGQVFAELDNDGCSSSDDELHPCEDLVGEGADGEFYFSFNKSFGIFNEIMDLYKKINDGTEIDAYIRHLTGVNFNADLGLLRFLEALPDVTVISSEWTSGPGSSGDSFYITVDREFQSGLLGKLTDIQRRLEIFIKAGSFTKEIQAEL